jgi:hypothetical protein
MHHLQFIPAEDADGLLTDTAEIASDAVYMKRFMKDREGNALTHKMIDDLSKNGKDANDQLYATGQAMQALIKMRDQKAA